MDYQKNRDYQLFELINISNTMNSGENRGLKKVEGENAYFDSPLEAESWIELYGKKNVEYVILEVLKRK